MESIGNKMSENERVSEGCSIISGESVRCESVSEYEYECESERVKMMKKEVELIK